MKGLAALGLAFGGATSALAQGPTVTGELTLDARSPIRIDQPYQRSDRVYDAGLRVRADLGAGMQATVAAQRRFFLTRVTLAQVERSVGGGGAVRAGLLRAPFGIWDPQETYRSGLIDYPMPRVDYGETGGDHAVSGVGGTLARGGWQFDGALFDGSGVSVWNTRERLNGAVGRVQAFVPPGAIVGVSHWSGTQPGYFGPVSITLSGLDVRWSRPYLVVRAEALSGRLAGGRYVGAYGDVFYRLPGLPAVTLAARAEQLRPSPRFGTARQQTLGVRWTATPEWSVVVNWRTNRIAGRYPGTWTPQTPPGGAWIVQVYRTLSLGK